MFVFQGIYLPCSKNTSNDALATMTKASSTHMSSRSDQSTIKSNSTSFCVIFSLLEAKQLWQQFSGLSYTWLITRTGKDVYRRRYFFIWCMDAVPANFFSSPSWPSDSAACRIFHELILNKYVLLNLPVIVVRLTHGVQCSADILHLPIGGITNQNNGVLTFFFLRTTFIICLFHFAVRERYLICIML